RPRRSPRSRGCSADGRRPGRVLPGRRRDPGAPGLATPAAILWHQVDPPTLASRLKLILNQRLVRRICEGCRKPSPVTDRILKLMGLTPDEALDLKVHQGSGCDSCGPLSPGYAGRVA